VRLSRGMRSIARSFRETLEGVSQMAVNATLTRR